VALEDGRGRVIAGDREDVGLEGEHARQQRVEALQRGDLRVEIAVLARLVGVLVMQEEEVVMLPLLLEGVDLLRERPARLEHLHPDEAGEPAVHRIRRDGPGLVVVGHDSHAGPDARRAHHARHLLLRGPGVAAPRAAPAAAGSGEVGLHVQEDRAGDVAGGVGVAAAARGIQIPPHVHDPQVGVVQVVRQPVGGDDRFQGLLA